MACLNSFIDPVTPFASRDSRNTRLFLLINISFEDRFETSDYKSERPLKFDPLALVLNDF